mmetsp:Transcript_9270/g.25080  ORF Transcript_9270/g.25080 Transcript_9270/m.25080 type:complete len:212 (-) Transcript_9270:550-1185(-)
MITQVSVLLPVLSHYYHAATGTFLCDHRVLHIVARASQSGIDVASSTFRGGPPRFLRNRLSHGTMFVCDAQHARRGRCLNDGRHNCAVFIELVFVIEYLIGRVDGNGGASMRKDLHRIHRYQRGLLHQHVAREEIAESVAENGVAGGADQAVSWFHVLACEGLEFASAFLVVVASDAVGSAAAAAIAVAVVASAVVGLWRILGVFGKILLR